MPNMKVVCKLSLQMLIFIFLFVCFIYFFMKDQMETFMKGRTTITRRVEEVNSMEFPTITICLDPATKLSVAKKYGFKNINDKFNIDVPNSNLSKVFDEITYGLDQDFFIRNYNGKQIHLGLNNIDAYLRAIKMPFFVEAIKTYNSGTCIKLDPRFQMVSTFYRLRLSIELSSNIKSEDKIDSVLFIFTSNNSWVNILHNIWPQYKPYKASIDFTKEYTHLLLQPEEVYFKEGTENSADCLKNLIENLNCSYPCTVTTLPGVPYCQNANEHKCIVKCLDTYKQHTNCYMTKKATIYNLNDRVENPYHEDKNTLKTDVYIAMNAMKKIIKEEVYVLTFQDLIGSVGGSLGLFFGFSFSAALFSVLNKLFQ